MSQATAAKALPTLIHCQRGWRRLGPYRYSTATRFVVTNLTTRNARRLYEDVYRRRGQAENHINILKTHLAADCTSCMKASAKPAAFVPARRRVLVDVGLAPVNAAAIHVARRAVRHVAPAARSRSPRASSSMKTIDQGFICRHRVADKTSCASRSKQSRVSPPERRGVTPRKPNSLCRCQTHKPPSPAWGEHPVARHGRLGAMLPTAKSRPPVGRQARENASVPASSGEIGGLCQTQPRTTAQGPRGLAAQ